MNIQNERYTSWYDINNNCIDDGGKEHTMIDQFMMSNSMIKYLTSVSIDHAYTASCSSMYSDHWPIIVDFNLTSSFISQFKTNQK